MYVSVIGIDRYRAWSRLHNAVRDARGALDAFVRLGFEPLGAPLLDEAATGKALHHLVTDDLPVLPMYFRLSATVFREGVTGIIGQTVPQTRGSWNIADWGVN